MKNRIFFSQKYNCYLDGWNGSHDALIVGDFAFLLRDIEIHSHQHALALKLGFCFQIIKDNLKKRTSLEYT